jgi:hypothetical protein
VPLLDRRRRRIWWKEQNLSGYLFGRSWFESGTSRIKGRRVPQRWFFSVFILYRYSFIALLIPVVNNAAAEWTDWSGRTSKVLAVVTLWHKLNRVVWGHAVVDGRPNHLTSRVYTSCTPSLSRLQNNATNGRTDRRASNDVMLSWSPENAEPASPSVLLPIRSTILFTCNNGQDVY